MDTMTGQVVTTDDRSRAVLPGQRNQMFLMRLNADGSILLQPAQVVTNAQTEYDSSSDLQKLLTSAAASKTVRRRRSRRTA